MKTYMIAVLVICSLGACIKSEISTDNTASEYWLIPRNEVINSFENRDGIESIDHPVFVKVNEVEYLKETDLAFSVKENNIVKVYPIKIMQTHEIVNDSIGNLHFVVSYCPITRSGVCFNRKIGNEITEFGVSGMLYKDNLMPYDRNTESIWSQMLGKCVHGNHVDVSIEPIMMITTNWLTIKSAYPNALVLKDDNMENCLCELKNEGFTDGTTSGNTEGFLPGGSFYGIINNFKVTLYSYESLKDQMTGINQNFLLIGGGSYNYISAFRKNTQSSYSIVDDMLPIVLSDDMGNQWDMFGYAIEGPKKGQRLKILYTYTASLWAWESFYDVEKVLEF